MKMPDRIGKEMLAPCGFDCIVCYRHLKPKGFCRGCLTDDDTGKTAHCRACNIKECAKGKKIVYCFECSEFPCKALENIDRNYVKRYGVSLVNNGARAREIGTDAFMSEEKVRWTCSKCCGVISLHDSECSECKVKL